MARLYVPISASASDDARLVCAGNDAELLWFRALQLAKRTETDGVLNEAQLLRISPRGRRCIDALVEVGLLRPHGDTAFYLAGWLDWNESLDAIHSKRRKDRERKAARISGGIQTDSERNPDGGSPDSALREKRREEKRREVDTSTRTGSHRQRARDEILDSLALIDAPRGDLAEVTRSAWSHLAKIRRDLPADVTVAEIDARVAEYRRKHPTWDCTAAAVAKHWHTLTPRVAPKQCGRWTDGGDPARLPSVDDIRSGAYQPGPARF